MKKIVHIIIGLNVGGAELMLQRLVLHSSKNSEFEHIVISLTDLGVIGPELHDKGIEVYSLGMKNSLFVPAILLRLRKLLKVIKPDVVQTWMYHADFLGGLAAKSVGVKNIIWGIRTTDVSQGASKLTVHLSKLCAKLSYHIPNTIVCAAHASRDYHVGIGYDENKMLVIPNGFDLDSIVVSDKDRQMIRRNNNLFSNDIVIGSIGRFNTVKNQKLFIEVASVLVKKVPNLKFMIVGRGNDAENKKLVSWIKDYNLEDSFRLLGQRDDVPKCLKAMDIFCLHSKTEGFPNVLVEAMATGLPCVSTNVGDVEYILQDFGHIVPPNDIQVLTDALTLTINSVLKGEVEKIKLSSRDYINENFSINKVYKLYLEVWKL